MHEIAWDITRFTRGDVGDLMEQFREDRTQLGAGNSGTQAKVPPAAAEPDVRIAFAAQVEAVRFIERALVSVA